MLNKVEIRNNIEVSDVVWQWKLGTFTFSIKYMAHKEWVSVKDKVNSKLLKKTVYKMEEQEVYKWIRYNGNNAHYYQRAFKKGYGADLTLGYADTHNKKAHCYNNNNMLLVISDIQLINYNVKVQDRKKIVGFILSVRNWISDMRTLYHKKYNVSSIVKKRDKSHYLVKMWRKKINYMIDDAIYRELSKKLVKMNGA